ncbi:threonine-phosphate decarboxylase [Pedobacter cryoconitis]|uniref:Aminotransferase n=1 Tax=Pedobacter cryoconitis TaxID=188932 RepID=A0A7W8ZPN9_9SPHI|nr:aminotransferase class I/II-fold pyridoxal phosphate-dependent enzyme [Pedobacter cryoconitis]MBB5637902.1 threonine-phosphate decarboxylase [Pedobacter cryoconitis]
MFQGHGDDGYLYGQTLAADFSTNVWHGGPPKGLKEHLFSQWENVQRYPEVLAESLTEKIALSCNFKAENILVTNGSTESIYLIAQAYQQRKTTLIIPAFAEYEDACKMFGHEISFLDWSALQTGITPGTELLFICNPNNPTGAVYPDLEQLIQKHSNILFVVDEAFIEFTFSVISVIALIEKYTNLIVLRSMTKAYAIPGLRLGYLAANPVLIERLRSFKLPWSVNTMAIAAGHFIFDHAKTIEIPLQQLLADQADFSKKLSASGLIVYPSHTHFFLARTNWQTAAALKQFLLKEFNILIRNADNFRGLTDKHIRIATLSKNKNQLLINALTKWKPI